MVSSHDRKTRAWNGSVSIRAPTSAPGPNGSMMTSIPRLRNTFRSDSPNSCCAGLHLCDTKQRTAAARGLLDIATTPTASGAPRHKRHRRTFFAAVFSLCALRTEPTPLRLVDRHGCPPEQPGKHAPSRRPHKSFSHPSLNRSSIPWVGEKLPAGIAKDVPHGEYVYTPYVGISSAEKVPPMGQMALP